MYNDSICDAAKEIEIYNSTILVTGATGLIGSCVIDILLAANEQLSANNTIYALGRSRERIVERFGDNVIPVVQSITDPLPKNLPVNYILHGASNADPRTYTVHPVDTIITNIIGTKNVLDYCVLHSDVRMLFTSTFEVYGHIDDVMVYSENMSGIIDQTYLRNGYPESKRTCELMLRSYVEEYQVDALIARLSSVYGPTMLKNDSKAHAQFIKKALENKDIVLKSKGEQCRTYTYVIDAARALLMVLKKGRKGEIYNVSNMNSIASIAEVAHICADIAGTKVVFSQPDEVEKKGFSRPHHCILDNAKLRAMGWEEKYSLRDGLYETINYLKASVEKQIE